MGSLQRFLKYAAAFEESYRDDDWSRIEPFFTEDAVYETFADPPFGARLEGRDAVLGYFQSSLDGFDRRFDERILELLEGPREQNGEVWIRWRGIYRIGGAPDLVLEGEETASFQGDRIRRLEDRIPPEAARQTEAFLKEHEARLRPVPA